MITARILLLLSTLTLASAGLAGCGDGDGDGVDFCTAFPADPLCQKTYAGGDDCTRALAIYFAGFDEGCADWQDCCFCQCWSNGRQVEVSNQPCTCGPQLPQGCDGEILEFAQECLAQPSACRQIGAENIGYLCGEW